MDSALFLIACIAFGMLCLWSTRPSGSPGWSPFDMRPADDPPAPPATRGYRRPGDRSS